MRAWMLLTLLSCAPPALAYTVCLEKATGKVVQSQSADAPGLCQRDLVAQNPQYGYAAADIEERIVDRATWVALNKAWDENPVNPDVVKRKAQVNPDAELAAAITAVDTATILDPAAKAAVESLKAALLGKTKQGRVKAEKP